MKTKSSIADTARLGLVKEMLQVILGLETETLERVMRTIQGSEDAADIKTINMRKRIGNRAMIYLRNAIDIARNEGDEQHNDDADIDMSKDPDLEPGHQHDRGRRQDEPMRESFSFKNYLTELHVDPTDQNARRELDQAARRDPRQQATIDANKARGEIDLAKAADPGDPMRQIDMKIAQLSHQMAMLQKRKAQMVQQQGG